MSNATGVNIDGGTVNMDRIAPNDANSENTRNSDTGLPLKETPSWFCKLVASKPLSVFVVTLGCHVLLLLLTVVLIVSGYDILPADFGRVPLNLEKDDSKLRFDAWNFAKYSGAVIANPANAGSQDERSITYQTLEFVYESQNDNTLTRENLLQMQERENSVSQKKIYQEKLCQLQGRNGTRICKPPFSILRFFDGSYRNLHTEFYDPSFENILRVLMLARSLNLTKSYLAYHLGKDVRFDVVNNVVYTSYCRSLLFIGWPLQGYENVQEKEGDQIEKLGNYIYQEFGSSLATMAEEGVGRMNFYYSNLALQRKETQNQVITDMKLAILSFAFIVIFMWLQTGSLWITSWAIFSILSSFNIANLMYRIILDYRYFGLFHVLSIFIILGIGADDIFVFTDTWKQSEGRVFPSIAHRLDFVYRRAAKAMFITSFTTIAAFLSNVPSPLLAISSFGVFSAVLVLVNYCSVVVFFPAVVMLHETHRKGKCCCCLFTTCKRMLPERNENAASHGEINRRRLGSYVIEFFEETFFTKVIKDKISRCVVLALFLVIIIASIVFVARLEPNEDQVEIWRPESNWAKIRKLRRTKFAASPEDLVVKVTIVWGLKNQDRSHCHHTDFKCRGKTVIDTSFDMNSPPCQRSVLNICEKIKALSTDEMEKLKLRRNPVTGDVEMECFMVRMNEYFKEEGNKTKYSSGLSFPFNAQKMRTLMAGNPSLYNTSTLSQDYYRFFEVGLGFFLRDGSRTRFVNNYDYKTYSKYIAATNDITSSGTHEGVKLQENQYGNRLLFMAVAVNTTLQVMNLGYRTGLPVHDSWENFIQTEMKSMPQSCNKAFQATVEGFNMWHWLKVQKTLIKNAVQGIVVGLFLALIVLVIATTNVIVGILATVTIAMITCSVLATITLLGWKLGVLESVNMTLVVGLSVDYVVHLAEGYIELEGGNRLTRTKHAMGHVGISVISGACSTLGASAFMFAGKIIFFMQFGIFIFCTIGFSTLYSLVFFSTLLTLIGPQGNYGSILPVVRKARDLLRGKNKYDVDCIQCHGKGYLRRNTEDT